MKDWTALERVLRELHRILLRRASREYMQVNGLAEEPGPGDLLMLATRDENFAWLRSLSELMADIDHLREQPEARDQPGVRAAVRGAVEQLLNPPADQQQASAFAARYWSHVHADPEVAIAHGAVRQALRDWPAPAEADHRQVIAEHTRKK
ncbi:hypothetical protein HHL11_25715 [Ramlibacter sp. G-1-2-2]|uniref:Uncharacterized protein n=1 Tax=Ramlibacter agri TaxID=2728837 RepID=A0A848HCG9_9BURK|nr:hypothetical protein [Ramlibacter agri]NML47170.1 hypothetical protein [Ramlibacter agri]